VKLFGDLKVRAGQYWRLEDLKCFAEFLERRFPAFRGRGGRLTGLLPDVNSRTPATAGERAIEGIGAGRRGWS
jgi:hypothetical protein